MASRPIGKAALCRVFFLAAARRRPLNPQSIGKLLALIAGNLSAQADCEITLEANPGTVDSDQFFGYRDAGVNRISVGVQSFQTRCSSFSAAFIPPMKRATRSQSCAGPDSTISALI